MVRAFANKDVKGSQDPQSKVDDSVQMGTLIGGNPKRCFKSDIPSPDFKVQDEMTLGKTLREETSMTCCSWSSERLAQSAFVSSEKNSLMGVLKLTTGGQTAPECG